MEFAPGTGNLDLFSVTVGSPAGGLLGEPASESRLTPLGTLGFDPDVTAPALGPGLSLGAGVVSAAKAVALLISIAAKSKN